MQWKRVKENTISIVTNVSFWSMQVVVFIVVKPVCGCIDFFFNMMFSFIYQMIFIGLVEIQMQACVKCLYSISVRKLFIGIKKNAYTHSSCRKSVSIFFMIKTHGQQ